MCPLLLASTLAGGQQTLCLTVVDCEGVLDRRMKAQPLSRIGRQAAQAPVGALGDGFPTSCLGRNIHSLILKMLVIPKRKRVERKVWRGKFFMVNDSFDSWSSKLSNWGVRHPGHARIASGHTCHFEAIEKVHVVWDDSRTSSQGKE